MFAKLNAVNLLLAPGCRLGHLFRTDLPDLEVTIRHDMGVAHVSQSDPPCAVNGVIGIAPLQGVLAVGLQFDIGADFQHAHPGELARFVAGNVLVFA